MEEINSNLIFENIESINFEFKNDRKNDVLRRTLDIKIGDYDYSKWDKEYQKYIQTLPADEVIQTMICKFINIYGITSVEIDDKNINTRNNIISGKEINIALTNNKSIKIITPILDDKVVKTILNFIKDNKKKYMLNKYKTKLIDNIYIIPSSFYSEINYYDKIIEDDIQNSLMFVNYKNRGSETEFMMIENIIDEVIRSFFNKYKNQIDSYSMSDNELKITFLDNKNIIVKDMSYINKNDDFFSEVKNQLINVKIKKLNRRGV